MLPCFLSGRILPQRKYLKKALFRKFFSIFFITSAVLIAFLTHRKINRGFEVYKIQKPQFVNFDSFSYPQKNIDFLFNQKFYFLDKGTQFYVFESEDKKYVVKFFRFDRLIPSSWSYFFPRKRKELMEKMYTRIQRLDRACHLAYEKYAEESALLFIHNSEDSFEKKRIQIVTPLGKRIDINPTKVCFSIQKRAIRLKKAFEITQSLQEKKKIIQSFFSLFLKRAQEHIINTDPNLWENFGYIDRVVEFDFGDFIEDGSLIVSKKFVEELNKYAIPLRNWLEEIYPESLKDFDNERTKCLKVHAEKFS